MSSRDLYLILIKILHKMGWHKEWRKLAKKQRRKRIRGQLAKERDEMMRIEIEKREKSPTHRKWLEEQAALETFAYHEEERIAKERQAKWEADEVEAHERWKEQQIRLAQARAEKAKQELLIREEWEREQKKIKDEEERKQKEQDEKRRSQEEILAQIDAFISGTADLPASAINSRETHPGHPECPFFSKTGACRFRDNCSRNHIRPGISTVLLFPNFYDHFGMQSSQQYEYDTDVGLEYEDSDTYSHFLEFYDDILPELETCGEIRQLKVCCNQEPHLRGNVYVEYFSERHALKAYRLFQGRYYGGRQLTVLFTNIPSWKNALCGLFHKQRCPKGRTCNFLHVFWNPGNAFREADFDRSPRNLRQSPSHRKRLRSSDNRWSESPEHVDVRTHQRTRDRSSSRDRSRRKRRRSRERRLHSKDRKHEKSRTRRKSKTRNRESSHSSRMSKHKNDKEKYEKQKENTPSPTSKKSKKGSKPDKSNRKCDASETCDSISKLKTIPAKEIVFQKSVKPMSVNT